jgi:hypothetical protein
VDSYFEVVKTAAKHFRNQIAHRYATQLRHSVQPQTPETDERKSVYNCDRPVSQNAINSALKKSVSQTERRLKCASFGFGPAKNHRNKGFREVTTNSQSNPQASTAPLTSNQQFNPDLLSNRPDSYQAVSQPSKYSDLLDGIHNIGLFEIYLSSPMVQFAAHLEKGYV